MLDFISKDVQKYMAENGLEFSDFEKATVIYNSALSVKEKHEALENLARETADEALKQQIADRLHDDKQGMEAFTNNTEGCIYVVYDDYREKTRLFY